MSCKESMNRTNASPTDSLRVISTPDLYNISLKWANEFKNFILRWKLKYYRFRIKKRQIKLIAKGNIGFVSDEYYSGLYQSLWKVVVGRDIIVPVINSKNPFSDEIYKQGISTERLAQFFKKSG